MARLPALISDIAAHDLRDRSTIQLIARLVREAGWIQTTKRGRGAAEMTAQDAAALLMAVCVTDNPSQAAHLTETFLTIPQVGRPPSLHDAPPMIRAMTQADHLGEAVVALLDGVGEPENAADGAVKEATLRLLVNRREARWHIAWAPHHGEGLVELGLLFGANLSAADTPLDRNIEVLISLGTFGRINRLLTAAS